MGRSIQVKESQAFQTNLGTREVQPMKHRFDAVRSRFTGYEGYFDYLLMSDEDFFDACEDLQECLRALEDPMLAVFHRRFRVLCEELEKEIQTYLNEYASVQVDDTRESSITIS